MNKKNFYENNIKFGIVSMIMKLEENIRGSIRAEQGNGQGKNNMKFIQTCIFETLRIQDMHPLYSL